MVVGYSNSDDGAATLHQYDVSPLTISATQALAHANYAKAQALVQAKAGTVFREYAGL